MSGHKTPILVGVPRNITCTTYISGTAKMEWVLEGVAEPLEVREDGGQKLIVSLNFPDTTSDGKNLTCRVTTHGNSTYEEVISIDVKGITRELAT